MENSESHKEITYYELNASQEVVMMQCRYSLFKRVVNILSSISADDIDFDVMEKAINLAIERNDCTRLQFVKKGKQLVQYFRTENLVKIPRYTFKTKQAQESFITRESKKPIKYMKGKVIEPFFIKTYDNKCMVFFKVCHLIFDVYGINVFYNDLFGVYEALKNNTALPEAPKTFEEVLQNDIKIKHDEVKKASDYKYFEDLLSSNEEPYYGGLDGYTNKYIQKQRKKNKRYAPLLFIKNDTKMYGHSIPDEVTKKLFDYSTQNKMTIANLLFYMYSLTQSRINGDLPCLMPIELCNLRGTLKEKKAAGTKVQSLLCYTRVDKDKTFLENLNEFITMQGENQRHIGMSDLEADALLFKIFKPDLLKMYYGIAYSFIPYKKNDKFEVMYYSNGKCALPTYVAVMYDYEKNTIDIGYDCQVNLVSESNVKEFHENLISCINQTLDNPKILVKDIKIKEISK